jgi:hypothetical protein
MLDAIDLAEEFGTLWDDEAERRRETVQEGSCQGKGSVGLARPADTPGIR